LTALLLQVEDCFTGRMVCPGELSAPAVALRSAVGCRGVTCDVPKVPRIGVG